MMTYQQILNWIRPLAENLRLMRGVTNLNDATLTAIAEQLTRRSFTNAHAEVAEAWLLFGDWEQTFRRNKDIYLNDFIPSKAQFESIRNLDRVIHQAAMKLIPSIIKTDYIHRTRAKEFIDNEVGIILQERAKAQPQPEIDVAKEAMLDELNQKSETIRLLRECLTQCVECLESADVKNLFSAKDSHHFNQYRLILFKSHRRLQLLASTNKTQADTNETQADTNDTDTAINMLQPQQEEVCA